jgi:hypothetical protein
MNRVDVASSVAVMKCGNRGKLVFLFVTFLVCTISTAYSANRFWIAAGSANWNNTANWSATSGGAGGASVPGSADNVFFDANGLGNCALPASSVTIISITVGAGYTGTISLGSSPFIVTGTTAFSGGNFTGGSSAIEFRNGFTLSGTNFTSTSGTLEITTGNISFTSGTFTHNNGTVRSRQTGADLSIAGNFTFNNLEIVGLFSGTTVNSNLQVNGNLLLDAGATGGLDLNAAVGVVITVNGNVTVSAGTGTLYINDLTLDIKGNFTQNHTCACGGGTGTLQFSGTGNQIFSSTASAFQGYLPGVIINKPSGNLTLSGVLTISGSVWTYVAGTMAASSSTVLFYNSNITIAGDQTFNHVIISTLFKTVVVSNDVITNGDLTIDGTTGSTAITINGSITVNGTFTMNGSNNIPFSTGTIYARGDIYAANTSPGAPGNGILEIDGTGNQYFDGSAVAGNGTIGSIRINKPSGTLTLGPNTISYDGTWTYLSGTVDASTNSSTVAFESSGSSTINAPAASMSFHNFSISCSFRTLTLQSNIDFNGSLTIAADSELNTSASNYSVNIGGNWTSNTGSIFTQNSSTVTFDGAGAQTYTSSAATIITFSRLTINKPSGTLTLQRRMDIGITLTLTSGTVTTTSTNILQMNNGSSCNIGNANSYIDGPMRYVMASASTRTLNFPVGKSGTWRPAVLVTTHSTAASANYTAELIASSAQALGYTMDATIDRVSLLRYWQIDRAGAGNFTSATVQLYYDNEGVNDYTNLAVAKTNGAGTHWFDIGGTATGNGIGSITSSSFTTFSKFSLANKTGSSNPLPITLASFQGEFDKNRNVVKLKWQTLSEVNNEYFIVQYLNGNNTFTDLVKIPSLSESGNSSQKLDYVYEHSNPPNGKNYFRLKQVDLDGSSSLSDIVYVEVTTDFVVYPNPIAGKTVKINLPFTSDATYRCLITDTQGRTIFNGAILASLSGETIAIELDKETPPGIYFLRLTSGNNHFNTRIAVK